MLHQSKLRNNDTLTPWIVSLALGWSWMRKTCSVRYASRRGGVIVSGGFGTVVSWPANTNPTDSSVPPRLIGYLD